MIECNTFFNKKKLVPRKKLKFRPAVYAVIINKKNVLLLTIKSTNKYFLPGGAVELGEKIEDALAREVMEEVGIEIEIKKFLKLKESFFYYDLWNEAYQSINFFYKCKPKTLLLEGVKLDDDQEINPEWVSIKKLRADDFHVFGEDIMELLKECAV